MPISFLGGKYRVNLQTRGGVRYTVSIKNGCIVGGTIYFPNGTSQKVTAPFMIKVLRKVFLDNKNLNGAYQSARGSTHQYQIPDRDGRYLDPSNEVDAGSVEEIMDDYYGGTRPNIFTRPALGDILQALENSMDRNCFTFVDAQGNLQSMPKM